MSAAQIPGQQYGAQVDQVALQTAMPAPRDTTGRDLSVAAQQPAPESGPVQGVPVQGAQGADPMQLAAALRGQVGVLAAPTGRPDEPVTTGLTRGLGAGPEVLGLQRRSPLGEMMRMISRQSGDPLLADLADRANL